MHSVRIELAKLILVGTRISYQVTREMYLYNNINVLVTYLYCRFLLRFMDYGPAAGLQLWYLPYISRLPRSRSPFKGDTARARGTHITPGRPFCPYHGVILCIRITVGTQLFNSRYVRAKELRRKSWKGGCVVKKERVKLSRRGSATKRGEAPTPQGEGRHNRRNRTSGRD